MIYRIGVCLALIFSLSACNDFGRLLPIDGRMLNEINSHVVLGGIYREDPRRNEDERISIDDICLFHKDHAVKQPEPEPQSLAPASVVLIRDGELSAQAKSVIPNFLRARGNAYAEQNNIKTVRLNLINIKKYEVTNAELKKIREELLSGKDCSRWVDNVKTHTHSPIFQVSAVYVADFDIDVDIGQSSGVGADAQVNEQLKAEVEGRIQNALKISQDGKAHLIALDELSMEEWELFN